MTQHIILGPPGTGKTTELLRLVASSLAEGVAPDRIGFIAFTRKAAREALERAKVQFNLDFPYFRTIHSLCFRLLGVGRARLVDGPQLKEFAARMGVRFRANWEEGIFADSDELGDQLMQIDQMARLRRVSVEMYWSQRNEDLPWNQVSWFSRGYRAFKDSRDLLDFTDMLEHYLTPEGIVPKLDALFVDEAQDLSLLQWLVVNKLKVNVKNTIIAGDDDQAIFRWAGADVDQFIDLPGKRTILTQSYRVPAVIQRTAQSIVSQIKNRNVKDWKSTPKAGTLASIAYLEELDMAKDDWLILARNTYMLKEADEELRKQGLFFIQGGTVSIPPNTIVAIKAWESLRKNEDVPLEAMKALLPYLGLKVPKTLELDQDERCNREYLSYRFAFDLDGAWPIWHDALHRIPLESRSYIVAMLRRGEQLTKTPRIRLSTIHGVKGGEAANVVMFSDISRRVAKHLELMPDDEHRVFYVGVTRAKSTLSIVQPRTRLFYQLRRV